MPRPKTDRPHTPKYARAKLSRRESHYFQNALLSHPTKFYVRSYPVGNRTISPKLFPKTLVSPVNSAILELYCP
ncbi:hypothetical protein QUB00_01735 [Microcoleus sp. F8_C2]